MSRGAWLQLRTERDRLAAEVETLRRERDDALAERAMARGLLRVSSLREIEEKADEAARTLVAVRTAIQIATWLENHLAGLRAGILTPEDCVEDAYAEIAQRIRFHEWEADLDECADCGGSTAPGTPDPHVCR